METKFDKVYSLVKNGTKIRDACKQVGYSYASYFTQRRRKYGKSKRGIKVYDLPQLAPVAVRQPFIIFGSPQELAEFVRNFQ